MVMVEFFNFVVSLKTKSGSLSRHTIVEDEGHFSIIIFYVALGQSISLLLWSASSFWAAPQSLFVLISEALNNSQGSCPGGKGPQTCLDH